MSSSNRFLDSGFGTAETKRLVEREQVSRVTDRVDQEERGAIGGA